MRKMLLGLAAAVAISVGALSLDAATDEEDNPTALAGAMSGVSANVFVPLGEMRMPKPRTVSSR